MKLEKIQIEKLKLQVIIKANNQTICRFIRVDKTLWCCRSYNSKQDFTVIGGHQRLKVCQDLNTKK